MTSPLARPTLAYHIDRAGGARLDRRAARERWRHRLDRLSTALAGVLTGAILAGIVILWMR